MFATARQLAIATVLIGFALGTAANATTILIDFGREQDGETAETDRRTEDTGWNNISGTGGEALLEPDNDPLVDAAGNSSGISASDMPSSNTKGSRFSSSGISSLSSLTSPTGRSYPEDAFQDHIFANGGPDTLTLSGLTAPRYNFYFFAASSDSRDEDSKWTVTGAGTDSVIQDTEDDGDHSNNFSSVQGMAPDSNGEISIEFAPGPNSSDSLGRWNTLEVEAIPEPGSLALIGATGLMLLGRRRSRRSP